MKNRSLHELEGYLEKFKPLYYKKGEALLRAGDEPRGVFFLKKGFVRLYSLSKQGEELTLIIFKSGEIFPLTWMMSNIPNVYNLLAITPVEIKRVPRDDFLAYVKSNSDLLLDFLDEALNRLSRILQRMEYLVFGNAKNKVASILLICAERFGRKQGSKIIIELPLTHSDIASLVGLTRETASIEMKKLEKEGSIDYRGRLVLIKNLKGLRLESALDTEDDQAEFLGIAKNVTAIPR